MQIFIVANKLEREPRIVSGIHLDYVAYKNTLCEEPKLFLPAAPSTRGLPEAGTSVAQVKTGVCARARARARVCVPVRTCACFYTIVYCVKWFGF